MNLQPHTLYLAHSWYSVVQSLSHVQFFVTPRTAAPQASLSFTISQGLLRLMSIESVMPSNHLILCGPLLLLPSIFPSNRDFSNEFSVCMRWPKYWSFSFSFSINTSSEYWELISLQIDCPGDFQESSSVLQLKFEGINSLAFCFFYSPALTTVHNHWEDQSLD